MNIIPKATTKARFYRCVRFGKIAGFVSAPNASKQVTPKLREFHKVVLMLILGVSNIHASIEIGNDFTSSVVRDISDLQNTVKDVAGSTLNNVLRSTATPSNTKPPEVDTNPWSNLEDLVGNELVDANGNKVDVKTLEGKIIGLYFSAHWCGPCRKFTPKLVEFRNANTKDFEVIFVSADRSAADQQNYMQESGMKWPAIPFLSSRKSMLPKRFSVRGIPCLIIVDGKGNSISTQGRMEIESDSRALAKWKNFSPNR